MLPARLKMIIPKLISEHQGAFIQGKQIQDGILIEGELIDTRLKSKKPDATLIFIDAKEEEVENLLMILQVYEAITDLRVNLEKSIVISIGADHKINDLARILNCKIEALPIKYLGMALGATRKQTSIWDAILEKFKSKLAKWRRRFLSKSARIELINSALASLPIYFMSLIQMPASVEKKIMKYIRDFLWGAFVEKRKICWIGSDRVQKPRNLVVWELGISKLLIVP
ncbi:uncharacterized protein LOC113279301 [Papaver somniferum]|uniref:uncharacterized protein LOC113279301 n=1 Tax=Papaver somniferum TaxID=3469 RepID=UPI000E7019C8|nr:uncharacterized protein LOC113279301 [Papaver somniferum]